jgi:hypothetical protein
MQLWIFTVIPIWLRAMTLMQALPVFSIKAASKFSLIDPCFGPLHICPCLAGSGIGIEEELSTATAQAQGLAFVIVSVNKE